MTKNILTVLIFTTFLILSCETKPTESTSTDDDSDSDTISMNTNQEDFNEFFKKFTADSLFQIERVKFPWKIKMYSEDRIEVRQTSKQDWRFSTFYYEASYATRQEDAYTQELKIYGDTVKLEHRGVDNGIHIDYEFAPDKGKWTLVSGKDYSN